MENHKIELDDLLDFIEDGTWYEFASQVGGGIPHKKLQILVGGQSYRVVKDGKVIHRGVRPSKAVEIYNSI